MLHVGGAHCKVTSNGETFHQYCPNKFGLPIVKAAAEGGALNIAVLMTECNKKRGVPASMLAGDWDDVCAYVHHLMVPIDHPAVYYYHYSPLVPVVPVKCFIDMDLYLDEESDTNSLVTLQEAIDVVLEALNDQQPTQNYEHAIVAGVRGTNKNKFKHSYHVTFFGHLFQSMEDQKNFMKRLFPEDGSLIDMAVYTNGRKFRTPWTPKGSSSGNDLDAILLPIKRVSLEESKWATVDRVFNKTFFEQMDIMPHRDMNSYVIHENITPTGKRTNKAPKKQAYIDDHSPEYLRSVEVLQFFSPIMNVLIQHIQTYRRAQLNRSKTAEPNAGVPVFEAIFFETPVYSGMEGTWKVKVKGDTFCEYDYPRHHHSKGDKIALSLNLSSGYYNQLCHACNPTGSELKKHGMFDVNGFHIHPHNEIMSRPLIDINGKHGAVLFLQSLGENVIYHPSFGSTVYVYDELYKLWFHDGEAIGILTKHKNDYKKAYNNYCKNAMFKTTESMIKKQMEKKETKAEKKTRADFDLLCSRDPNKDLSGIQFMETLVNNYTSAFPVQTGYALNSIPELVPMNDGNCFNVFTGETVPRTQEMRFTNMMNTSRKDIEDDECAEIREWFLEISANRPDLAKYHQRVIGYCMTMLTLDRHFYVNIGLGRNGKGVLHKFLKTCFGSGDLGTARYCMLHENFFLASANNRNASENATPARMEMEHKSLYLVEELPSQKIATSLIKKISSNDPTYGRQLYQTARKIEVTGKLIINTNNVPNIPGDDIATWDRMVLIPWDVRYAPPNTPTNPKKWILPSDAAKVDRIVTLTSAFLTVCVNELHAFYKESLVDGRPTKAGFPLPDCVVETGTKKREESFPLIPFIKKYVVTDRTKAASVQEIFYAYRCYMERRKKKTFENMDNFPQMLDKIGLETTFDEDSLETFVVGRSLTPAGSLLAEEERNKQQKISGDMSFNNDGEFFPSYRPQNPSKKQRTCPFNPF